jgi:phospholipid/cholesterol/gamma-HCH transport system substrate-binding protein
MLTRRLLGAALLIAAVGLALLGIAKPDPFHHPQVVHAIFDRVQAMAKVQRDVRVAGVRVGSIGTVRRVGNHADVALLLDQRIPMYRDAHAALRPHTPFEGTSFVDLDPGSPSAGPLGSQPIPMTQTGVFVSAGDVLSTFKPDVRRSFQIIVHELARALAGPAQQGLSTAIHNAPDLLSQTSVVARALRGPHGDELRTLIPATAATVDALAGRDGELASVARNARRTLDAVAVDGGAPFAASLARLPGALAGVSAASDALVGVLDRADRASSALIPTLEAIPPTTTPLTALFRQADPTLVKMPPIVEDFARTLRSLAVASGALSQVFAALRTTGSLLTSSLNPYLNSRSALGPPVYLQLMASLTGFTGTLSSFETRTQFFQAPGHGLRGTLQFPFSVPFPPSNLSIPCSVIAKLNAQGAALALQFGLCTP